MHRVIVLMTVIIMYSIMIDTFLEVNNIIEVFVDNVIINKWEYKETQVKLYFNDVLLYY